MGINFIMLPTVVVSRRGSERIASGHPWVYRSDIVDTGDAGAGEVVRVKDKRSHFLGHAHYSASSEIAVRMLATRDRPIDREFFRERIAQAIAHREKVV